MARTAKGKPTKVRTIRVDEDVWAVLQAMPGVNEGLRGVLVDGAATPEPDCEHRNVIVSLRAEVEALTAENEFLHGEIRNAQTQEAPVENKAMLADLKNLVASIESDTPPPVAPAPKKALSVAQQKALDEQNQLKKIADCDVVAQLMGRDDIVYDADVTPSRSVIVPPRQPGNTITRVREILRQAERKPLTRPSGNMMGKKRGEPR